MGKEKAGFLSPKAISNRIKTKGLQKLKWWCEMCQKQCRDENGFKCHITSESHQRQLLIFAENSKSFIDAFSDAFLQGYLDTLRVRFNTRRVAANNVYQEYIKEKDHTHMNATQWITLTDFVKWLGKHGYAKVDETEKGWFLQYIPRDADHLMKQFNKGRREKEEVDDEDRQRDFLEQQMERAGAADNTETAEATELQRGEGEEKVTFSLGASAAPSTGAAADVKPPKPMSRPGVTLSRPAGVFSDPSAKRVKTEVKVEKQKQRKPLSALAELKAQEEAERERKLRKDFWLAEGILVRIQSPSQPSLHQRKAVVKDVVDRYRGLLAPVDGGQEVTLHQRDLLTVTPPPGKPVKIVNGGYRGESGLVLSVDPLARVASLTISSGPRRGRLLERIAFADFSKLP